ncbi:MAG TPA: general secretion pathway protein GspK, partial [Pseudomonadaceae bacterium]|nr:general secretion pathway protein GspK [Pseudomonadaceae bacterium]
MRRSLPQQRGVALALLLWMLAALTLLVGGLISLSRSDVQLTALQLDQARAQAAAVGIAHVALRDMHTMALAGDLNAGAGLQGVYELAGLSLRVTIVPASALVNLNSAAAPLLEVLLRHVGGLDGTQAQELAAAIVDWRSGAVLDAEGNLMVDDGRGMFRVEEELLEVPGMSRDIFEKLRRFVHAQPDASGELNLLAAPESLLVAWREVDSAAVDFALESRQDVARDGAAPMGPLPPLSLAGSTIYCVDVEVVIAG